MYYSEIKAEYERCREEQRHIIMDHFAARGYRVNKRGGKGVKNYTSGGRINKNPFNLQSWKYVVMEKNGVHILLSLQSFDRDPSSQNVHVLVDRLGVYSYKNYNPKDACERMIPTSIDLPMDDTKFEELDSFIDNLI